MFFLLIFPLVILLSFIILQLDGESLPKGLEQMLL